MKSSESVHIMRVANMSFEFKRKTGRMTNSDDTLDGQKQRIKAKQGEINSMGGGEGGVSPTRI